MNRSKGFIVLNREILNWEWYGDLKTKVLFLHLLLTANHREQKWQGKVIGRGELITSIAHLAAETGLSEREVRTAINHLKSTGEITSTATNRYTLINVVNWGKYQDFDGEDDKQIDKQTDNQATSDRQASDKQATTNNKGTKEQRNNNIEKSAAKRTLSASKTAYGEFKNVLLTDEEYSKVKARIVGWEKVIENLSGYMESTGKKYKSHYSTLLTWARRDNKLKASEDVDLIADNMWTVPIFED